MLPTAPMARVLAAPVAHAVDRFPFLMGFLVSLVPVALGVGALIVQLYILGGVLCAIGFGLIAFVRGRWRKSKTFIDPTSAAGTYELRDAPEAEAASAVRGRDARAEPSEPRPMRARVST